MCLTAFGNNEKSHSAVRVETPPKIDGILDEEVWTNAPVATSFVQFEPQPGNPPSQKTEVKVLYDNSAVYIGAMLYDSSPDSILKELGNRDVGENNADLFGVFLDTYNDDMNCFAFIVSASGVQTDMKFFPEGEDEAWDAVWKSEVNITDKGWVAEFKIPYSAIRFPEKEEQTWGVNYIRIIRRYREKTAWNYIDPAIEGFVNQFGILNEIRNIEVPVRLSFTPYISYTTEHYPYNIDDKSNFSHSLRGGMDLKYGINESFTLDMTLVPDFGQIRSDNEILNLSPFEVRYDENRQFFTEGTELFNKAGLFYSRRIGKTPAGFDHVYDDLNDGETVIENPGESQLLNATKISGRTGNGLGIGFFNAMTANTYARISDSTGYTRKFNTEPFTNYNILVLDQSLKNNSYLSFINTNVYKEKEKYTANVSGTEFQFANKSNLYAIRGNGALSQKYAHGSNPEFGYKYYLNIGKISGNFLYNISQSVLSDKYDPNDLGYLQRNNEFDNNLSIKYNIYKPFWKMLTSYNSISFIHSSLYCPRKFTGFTIVANSWTTFRNYLTVGLEPIANPVESYDYFEARVPGRVFIKPGEYKIGGWISPDYRKRLAIDIDWGYWWANKYDQESYWYGLSPRLRVSDKIMIIYNFENDVSNNNIGYVDDVIDSINNEIITFGRRNINTITNTLNASYIFNNRSSVSFRLRHYWLRAEYDEFYTLGEDGYLETSGYSNNQDVNFNAFNIDMAFTWHFLPGSELNLVWKNAILDQENDVIKNFGKNISNTIQSPQTNSFSLKVIFYIDYLSLRKKEHNDIN
ncbi:MAG: DUF5916 domain-containing protein [Bacteroidota bacterium]